MNRLSVQLYPGPVQSAPGDAVLVPVPEDERPLRGDAGLVDWRLVGRVSSLVADGVYSGKIGDSTLLPGEGLIAAERVLLFGMGPLATLHGRGLERALTLAGVKLLALKTRTGVLAAPEGVDLEREVATVLLGLGRAVSVVHGSPDLTVVVPEADRRSSAVRDAWPEVCQTLQGAGVEASLHRLEPEGSPV